MQSKKDVELIRPPSGASTTLSGDTIPAGGGDDESNGFGRLLPPSKVPPTMEEARETNEVRTRGLL